MLSEAEAIAGRAHARAHALAQGSIPFILLMKLPPSHIRSSLFGTPQRRLYGIDQCTRSNDAQSVGEKIEPTTRTVDKHIGLQQLQHPAITYTRKKHHGMDMPPPESMPGEFLQVKIENCRQAEIDGCMNELIEIPEWQLRHVLPRHGADNENKDRKAYGFPELQSTRFCTHDSNQPLNLWMSDGRLADRVQMPDMVLWFRLPVSLVYLILFLDHAATYGPQPALLMAMRRSFHTPIIWVSSAVYRLQHASPRELTKNLISGILTDSARIFTPDCLRFTNSF